jgi:hypothetical protein
MEGMNTSKIIEHIRKTAYDQLAIKYADDPKLYPYPEMVQVTSFATFNQDYNGRFRYPAIAVFRDVRSVSGNLEAPIRQFEAGTFYLGYYDKVGASYTSQDVIEAYNRGEEAMRLLVDYYTNPPSEDAAFAFDLQGYDLDFSPVLQTGAGDQNMVIAVRLVLRLGYRVTNC